MQLNRKVLIYILSILVVINVVMWGIKIFVPDEAIKPYVRFISKTEFSPQQLQLIEEAARDSELSKKFGFAIVGPENQDKLQLHIQTYNITGTQATILTDKSGKKVYEKYTKILSKDELKSIAQKYE